MNVDAVRPHRSHGSGVFSREDFARIGDHVVFEEGVRVFHPEQIEIGENVYVGHGAILKGYYKNRMTIGDHTWIGQSCFLHSAGGIRIGRAVGIGPGVTILTSVHTEGEASQPVICNDLTFGEVVVGDGSDIGVNTILLPGVTIGEGCIIGAGSVVTKDVPAYSVAAGNPARVLRSRR
ncbi:acyltransferase [Methanoculleus sp. FWC-SCC1]|uniref:Acyltransferase n=1 Tax=Methanoculleus frigidifontis TaxID=2584085 RepID=A0ABT8M7P3_9EURY|nr:acyltransferase [Methanoculleus sp. FWC-SCC1]MDN7023946.1 acyltransferase [Methanoculleus sp. FWC-SCC1]